jgi:hemerythrin-like metal-binding protein
MRHKRGSSELRRCGQPTGEPDNSFQPASPEERQMALITWSAKLSVNVPQLDSQHQKPIAMVNELHEAMMTRQGKVILTGLLGKLVNYTVTHFKHEEQFMQETGFPGLVEHKKLHEDLTAQAATLKKRVDAGEASITLEVMSFLEKWLKNHIMASDRQYGEYAAKNASASPTK